jgi:hypothetical protein
MMTAIRAGWRFGWLREWPTEEDAMAQARRKLKRDG